MRTSFKIMAAAAVALGLALTPKSRAAITNGGFETGDLTGYTSIGDATVQGTNFAPPQGSNVGFLTNITNPNESFGSPATESISSLDSFSGLASGTLEGDNVQSGSAIQQTFSASAGDNISFQYNFLTNEPGAAGNQDFAYYTLSGPGIAGTEFVMLANPTTPVGTPPILNPTPPPDNSGIYGFLNGGVGTETGYLTGGFAIGTSGNYTLTFGVTNVNTTDGASGLLIDNLTGATGGNNGGGGGAVPLPAAALLAPAALALAGRYTVKLRKQVA